MSKENKLEKIVSLAKRRGFIFPGSEIYGGLANSWDYGPLGVYLKKNIKDLWWDKFIDRRDDIVGIDAALLMNSKVWKASGHLDNFTDLLIECRKCHQRFRADDLGYVKDKSGLYIIEAPGDIKKCPNCGSEFGLIEPERFNLLLQTFIGSVDPLNKLFALWLQFRKSDKYQDQAGKNIIAEKINDLFENIMDTLVFFRPETAQAMFVDFKNVLDTTRKRLPFGIAQIGKAFRNEITPGNFIFRTREFEQMEIEYFVEEKDWQKYFEQWREEMWKWMTDDLGLHKQNIHELEVPDGERAHYSKRTIDFEYDFPFGRKELYGLAYRTDFDLKNHFSEPPYQDESGHKFYPHVVEPTWGVDRSVLAVLCDAYDDSDKERIVLKLRPKLAPYKAAVFPLLKNKPELVSKAREIYLQLKAYGLGPIAWDDRGNIGKRYYAQDEIGTPSCITVDFQTLEDETVTVRDRDTMKQERVKIDEIAEILKKKTDVDIRNPSVL